jgi:hypothetical protein
MRKGSVALLPIVFCTLLSAQRAMNDAEIVRLVEAGVSEQVIVNMINARPGSYDVSPDAIIALKKIGTSDKVIAAIVSKAPTPSIAPGASSAPTQPSSADAPVERPGAPSQTEGEPLDAGPTVASGVIAPGARVVIAPMGGFETYFAAAVREKKVPITLTLDKTSAQFFVVSTDTEWEGFVYGSSGAANWNRAGGTAAFGSGASSTRGLEASIMLIDAKSKDVVWAYEVHKSSHGSLLFGTLGARGEQSVAEACAKHLGEYIEKGK